MQRVEAIDALVGLGSKKAVPGILEIAADRQEKDNWDRDTACRALGMLGDPT
jgi:HEAT repeat protein